MSKVLNSIRNSETYKNFMNANGEYLNYLTKLITSILMLMFCCHILVCIKINLAVDQDSKNNWWYSYVSGNDILSREFDTPYQFIVGF